MAIISLPLSFTNSFWSQDYRSGLEVVYSQLEQGTAENEQIVSFIRSRANAEAHIASALSVSPHTGSSGFARDDGASLLMAFRGLQSEAASQGQAHATVAKELHTLVADPFQQWADAYKARLAESKEVMVQGRLVGYESAQATLTKLKHDYHDKVRKADEAFDDARFAPNSGNVDNYTASPRMRPVDAPHTPRTPPQRSATVSERIANRLKEIQKRSAGALATAKAIASDEQTVFETPASPESNNSTLATPTQTASKGKGKEPEKLQFDQSTDISASPLAMSPVSSPTALKHPDSPTTPTAPSSISLGPQVSFPPGILADLLFQAASTMNLRPVRFPLLGEYPQCFTGEELVEWISQNVDAFGGDWDKSDDACRILAEKEGLLRRIGELGNPWDSSDDAWYQFRPKAFELGGRKHVLAPPQPPAPSSHDGVPAANDSVNGTASFDEPVLKAPISAFTSIVTKALAQASSTAEPTHVRLAHEAEAADAAYKIAARRLDRQRLTLEEKIEECFRILQRWESERLNAIKTCLLQYQGTLSNLPSALSHSMDRSSTLIAAFQPQNDLNALIERYRTGPFRPQPVLYKSIAHDERDVLFGGDLRKWSEATSAAWSAQHGPDPDTGKKDIIPIPLVLERLLEGLDLVYEKMDDDAEIRKAWIYEVPLSASHHLREALNASVAPADPNTESPPQSEIPVDLITKYDAPVIASTVKLWLLELDPPIALWEGWDEFRKIYPHVGSALDDEKEKKQARIESLSAALLKLPKIHLQVLDRVAGYLVKLIEATACDESNDVYINKLALSLGRAIVRPRVETGISIQDRLPTLLFIDLLQSYSQILPPTIIKKKRESERKVPIRKRTAMVDMRVSRSKVSFGAGEEEKKRILHAQHVKQNPSLIMNKRASVEPASPPPPVPPLPTIEKKEAALPPPPEKKMPERPASTEASGPPPEFKDPPPEPAEGNGAPPMPDFKDPPPEPPSPTSPSAPEKVAQEAAHTPTTTTPSPTQADIKRHSSSSSGSAHGIIRGPRMAGRGPRAPAGGTGGARPSSVLARASAFERRTMESDAEDNVLNAS